MFTKDYASSDESIFQPAPLSNPTNLMTGLKMFRSMFGTLTNIE